MHTDNKNGIRIFTVISLIVLLMVVATAMQSDAGEMDAWGQLSLSQRQKAAEAIGEDGARLFAEKQGWRPLYDSHTPDCISPGLIHKFLNLVHILLFKHGFVELLIL